MPLKSYGVLKCRALERELGTQSNPHFQVLVTDGKQKYRLAINVKSKESPSELLFLVKDNFQHPLTDRLAELGKDFFGYKELERKPGGLALDYIRANLFAPTQMKPLPFDVPGQDNDLNERLDLYIQRAIASQDAVLYAFGEAWGPESTPDKIFNFKPGNGIHDIHMNQGNSKQFEKDDGVWQDGGLLIHFPSRNQWVALFLAFQSQVFHTDDITGHRVQDTDHSTNEGIPESDRAVRIVAALVNPSGDDRAKESVTLINTLPTPVDLNGWSLADRLKHKRLLNGIILDPGACVKVPLSGNDVQLANDGGIITLLDREGLKIDGVSYTKDEVSKQGWTIVF